MSILPTVTPTVPSTPCAARRLPPAARQQLALDALRGQAITGLADEQQVSRKFVYAQVRHAHAALDQAFAPAASEPAPLLFWLPVTKPWLRQLVLGLTLICHSSLRGVTELLSDVFDYSISLGSVHNILQQAVQPARHANGAQDLAAVRIGAHDEIFQAGRPVLVGADVESTYCYLLSSEEHRDADTWAVRLLELQDQGFAPDATIADFGQSLRAAQKEVLPDVPCRGDVFHALHDLEQVTALLDKRAYQAIDTCSTLERKQAHHRQRKGRGHAQLAAKLRYARLGEVRALTLADEVATLVRWLREDLFAVNGLAYADRCALYDFVVAELQARVPQGPDALRAVATLLRHHRVDLLAFAACLEADLAQLAQDFQVPLSLVRRVLDVERLDPQQARRWPQQAVLQQQLRGRFYALRQAVAEVVCQTVRASSVIENLNSRLRNYFFLRRHLGPDYLALLQFFLNHRRFLRSEHRQRVGKSPTELLTGQTHPHWLEMLGYERFSRE